MLTLAAFAVCHEPRHGEAVAFADISSIPVCHEPRRGEAVTFANVRGARSVAVCAAASAHAWGSWCSSMCVRVLCVVSWPQVRVHDA